MKCYALWLLMLSFIFYLTKNCSSYPGCCKKLDYFNCGNIPPYKENKDEAHARCCMETLEILLKNRNHDDIFNVLEIATKVLGEAEVNDTISVHLDNIVVFLYKPTDDFKGLTISASDNKAILGPDMSNSTVTVHLPRELNAGPNNTIVYCMIRVSERTSLNGSEKLSDSRLIGLSVHGKNISGLQERVSLTIKTATSMNETLKPQCVFLNTTEKKFSTNGCETKWNQSHVTCSCDHLTYFGVLMVSADLSSKDQEIMSFITYIGCGISLAALVIAVLLFITNRKVRGDDSKKIHISLAVALILLNIHFLSSQAVAATSSSELCFYVALLLHYSLLGSFTWMALEGFHLYLLLIKVFNIYITRYLLKLSVVGWGLPAVIVAVMVITVRNIYGRTPVIPSRSENTAVCYVTNENVKMGTTLGLFSVVFLWNVIMFGLIAKQLMGDNFIQKIAIHKKNKAKREISILLSLMVLLGLTWGLIFFSFGQLTTPGLYVFCMLNPLQGLFILIYFVLSIKRIQAPTFMSSSETQSTRS